MPDQASLDALPEIDNLVQKMLARENQAEQDLQEVRALIHKYDQDLHNQLVGEIAAARDTAQAREEGDARAG